MNNLFLKAKKIVVTLSKSGFIAYFAGGWVRDFLLGISSDDIDIATDATPEDVQKLFSKTIPVGKEFGVVIVVVGRDQFEVSTFRSEERYLDGRRPEKVTYATPQEDAKRRDFTINGMFYDPLKDKIYDFVGGREDLEKKIIRTIGDPFERFEEDRLRMIRAVRFSAKFNFTIEEKTKKAIQQYADKLFPAVSVERVWQELEKIFSNPNPKQAILDLHKLCLLKTIFKDFGDIEKKDISSLCKAYCYFSAETPALFYVFALFPEADAKTLLRLSVFFKLSNKDKNLIERYIEARKLVKNSNTKLFQWAFFYAKKNAFLCLEAVGAIYQRDHFEKFLQEHKQRYEKLKTHIERIKKKKRIVSAKELERRGVFPGERMGELLLEAEKIAIEENIDDPKEILKKLKL